MTILVILLIDKNSLLQDISQNTLVTQATINDLNRLCLVFYPDESATTIDLDWLENHIYDKDNDNTKLFDSTVITWDATLVEQLPTGSYKKILANQRDLLEWLKQIEKWGFAKLTDLPDQNSIVLDVIRLFGYLSETNYGEYFEIRSEKSPVNLAYTKRGLQCHTDNPYRHPVPELQLFSCLRNGYPGRGIHRGGWV